MDYKENYAEIDVTILDQTGLAIKVSDGYKTAWIPKSCLEDPEEEFFDNDSTTVFIKYSMAREKGLI